MNTQHRNLAYRVHEAIFFFMVTVITGHILHSQVDPLPLFECVARTLADDCAFENTMNLFNHPPLGWINLWAICGLVSGIGHVYGKGKS